MSDDFYTQDVKLTPFWWEEAPRQAGTSGPVPETTDVAIVGSGYTGLSAALTVAAAGRRATVFESDEIGRGASTMNGGGYGLFLHSGLAKLIARFGQDKAVALYRECINAREYVNYLIDTHAIHCHARRFGRYNAAHSPKSYESMARDLELQKKLLGIEGDMVPRAEQRAIIGTDLYYGGRRYAHGGYLQPALYHDGLYRAATAAGAEVFGHTPVTAVHRDGDGFVVESPGRRTRARNVVLATNGYTPPALGWLRRRLVPVQSQMIATEAVEPELIRSVFPGNLVTGDTFRLKHYYRPAPDGRRLTFGGRAGGTEIGDPRRSGLHLYRRLISLFPQLKGIRITHSWAGFVAFPFDLLPHIGVHDGMHYAAGYCGSGIQTSTYFGHKIALAILGQREAATPFFDRPFRTRPFYTGKPWFLPPIQYYYGWCDNRLL